MLPRISFIAIGATVGRLQPRDTSPGPDPTPDESSRRCLAVPEISARHPIDYGDDRQMLPVDLDKSATRASWDEIEHDSFGVSAQGDTLGADSPRSAGAHVTTFGGYQWPASATWTGALYVRAKRYWQYRDIIEQGSTWPPTGTRAAEWLSLRYQDGRRYLGFYGEMIQSSASRTGVAGIKIFRPKSLDEAGSWHFNFGDPSDVDDTVGVDVLNEEIRGLPRPLEPIERPLEATDRPGTRGAVFIALRRAAQLWDRSLSGRSYGLMGPKLPFWQADS